MDAQDGGLFRPQVMRRSGNRLQGEVLVQPRLSHVLLTGGCLIWLLLMAYGAARVEWAVHEEIAGLIEIDRSSRLHGTVYLPAHARRYLSEGLAFEAAIEGSAASVPLRIRVAQISHELTASCPACTEGAEGSLYLPAEVELLDAQIHIGDQALTLSPGVRFHFSLPVGKQTLIEWLGFGPARDRTP